MPNLLLSQPIEPLAGLVQGIWSASVPQSNSIVKPLYSDAGSGIIFNLVGDVTIGNKTLKEGVIMLPVNTQTKNISLVGGAKLSGIRFHPAIGYGILRRHYSQPTLLQPEDDELYNLYQLHSELQELKNDEKQVQAIEVWAKQTLDYTHVIPAPLEKALESIKEGEQLGQLNKNVMLSQRQIERLFNHWLGLTPKHYQRIVRIKKAIRFLRLHQHINLADVAQQFGFSDQAHMTREFRTIACVTPKQIRHY